VDLATKPELLEGKPLGKSIENNIKNDFSRMNSQEVSHRKLTSSADAHPHNSTTSLNSQKH
jgi:hypothetical protein